MRTHAPLMPMACCLMAGIAAIEHLGDGTWLLVALTVMAIVVCLTRRFPHIQTASIGCCVALIGALLGLRATQQLCVEWPRERTTVEAVVIGEPMVKEKTVTVDLLTTEGHWKLKGRIERNAASEHIALGNGLAIHTYINKVHAWNNGHFDYQRYMACHGFAGELYARSSDWQGRPLSLANLSLTERARLRFLRWRHQLLERYRRWGLDTETYSIIAAMTLGEKSQLDATLKDTYAKAGTSHILALSGLHLMMIYAVVTLFVGWHRYKALSQAVIVIAIWAFAFLTGLPTSVVRSALMISIYALLSIGHRERMSVNTLAFTAMVMLAVNPLSLYDIGFQLSFMSVLAILMMNPLFERMVPPHILQRHRWLKMLWGMTTVSLSAQVGTAPLVAYYFGRFPTYFLLGNYIVIPLATLILYLALACVACWWWSTLQGVIAAALAWTVTTMNSLLATIAQLPGCSIEGIHLNAFGVAMVYVIIASAYLLLNVIRSPQARRV